MELPDRFDVIVVGTGMVQSVLAAAAARQGHSVLHLDTARYYGADWAAFTLEGLQQWIAETGGEIEDSQPETETLGDLEEGEVLVKLKEQPTVENIRETWTRQDVVEESEETPVSETKWTREELMKQSRKFNREAGAPLGSKLGKQREAMGNNLENLIGRPVSFWVASSGSKGK